MLPQKIETWIENNFFPQRCLLSGGIHSEVYEKALQIASRLQNISQEDIERGLCQDVLLLKEDGRSLGIGEKENPAQNSVRGLIVWCQQKPIKNYRMVILENFERVTHQAYNALLKILEEPPEKVLFLFTTQNHYRILETIRSRMVVVRIPKNETEKEISDLGDCQKFLRSDQGLWKFKKIENLVKQAQKEKLGKNLVLKFLDHLILLCQLSPQYFGFLENIFQARIAIDRNQNQRLVMERLVLQLEKNLA